jgi:hypothetical protein
LAGIFLPVFEHETTEQVDLYALKAPPVVLACLRAMAKRLTDRHGDLNLVARPVPIIEDPN